MEKNIFYTGVHFDAAVCKHDLSDIFRKHKNQNSDITFKIQNIQKSNLEIEN